jgi:hypothetical protein
LVAAAIIGNQGGGAARIEQYLPQSFPGLPNFEFVSHDSAYNGFLYSATDESGNILGYVTLTEGQGYGGPMVVVVSWSTDGIILGIEVPEHFEDLPWFNILIERNFFYQYIGRSYSQPLSLDEDVDAVSGSTISSIGVSIGVRGGRQILSEHLGDPYPQPREPIEFGLAEWLLVLGLGTVVTCRTVPVLRRHRNLRYLTLAYGFAVLGVWLAIPLSLTNFAVFMLGYGPHLATNIIMYILVFGVVGLALFMGRNFYCFWLCPFVAVQEGLNPSGYSLLPAAKWRRWLRNIRYFLVWFALMFTLLLANPTVSVFEPWNVLFSLKGPGDQWLLVLSTIFVAMIIHDFWCYYLCPVGAVMDIILKIRKGVIALWKRLVKPGQAMA